MFPMGLGYLAASLELAGIFEPAFRRRNLITRASRALRVLRVI